MQQYPIPHQDRWKNQNPAGPEGPHIGHSWHLCVIADEGRVTLEHMKALVKDSKFICKKCGRAASKEENLCNPILL